MGTPLQHSPKKILIRAPNWIGDAVMATPIVHDLKKNFPASTITVMCLPSIASVFEGNPFVDEIFSFSRLNEFERRQKQRNIINRLRQGHFDCGILLPNSFSSAWLFWRGRIQHRIGFSSDYRRLLLNHPVRFPSLRGKEHLVVTYKRLLAPLGISISNTSPGLFLHSQEIKSAQEILRKFHIPLSRPIVGINPGAAFGSAKCWLPDRFRAVTEKLIKEASVTVLYFGDKTGTPLTKDICKGLPPQVINLAGQTSLRELMGLISLCSVFLTNDSGPMHLAAALKIPLVALFGSTNEIATGPYLHGRIIHKHVECSPCYQRTCPIDFRCMTRIEVDEVVQALGEMLNPNGR